MKKLYIYFLFLAVFTACEETIELDPDQTEPVTVIEGTITNREQYHFIRVTQTIDFYAEGQPTPVTNALVRVTDNEGNVFDYEHNPAGEEGGNGYYVSSTPFAGEIGRSYSLSVSFDGLEYEASDELLPVTAIDSLEVELDEDEFADPEDPEYYYEVLFYAKEPQDREDYYLFKFYRNDSLILDSETDIYIADDEVLAEEINGIPTAGFYKLGDVAVVEMYSISHNAFLYYNDLLNLLNSDGGMFSPPPVNPRNNISNGAMGFFQTSAIASDTVKIE